MWPSAPQLSPSMVTATPQQPHWLPPSPFGFLWSPQLRLYKAIPCWLHFSTCSSPVVLSLPHVRTLYLIQFLMLCWASRHKSGFIATSSLILLLLCTVMQIPFFWYLRWHHMVGHSTPKGVVAHMLRTAVLVEGIWPYPLHLLQYSF